jgi:hypothetical protein
MRQRDALGLTLLLGALVAGCATVDTPAPPSSGATIPQPEARSTAPRKVGRNLSGFPMAFRQGYVDGCDSSAGALSRDERRYKSDMDYLMGWNDGYAICRR